MNKPVQTIMSGLILLLGYSHQALAADNATAAKPPSIQNVGQAMPAQVSFASKVGKTLTWKEDKFLPEDVRSVARAKAKFDPIY